VKRVMSSARAPAPVVRDQGHFLALEVVAAQGRRGDGLAQAVLDDLLPGLGRRGVAGLGDGDLLVRDGHVDRERLLAERQIDLHLSSSPSRSR